MTKRTVLVLIVGVFSLIPAVDAAAQPRWGRERMPQAGACFYEDRDYRGQYFCVQPGEDLRSLPRGMSDRISSVRLLGASEVTVFRDSDMRGRSARFTRDMRDLRREGWNDQISSIVVSGGYGYGRGRGRDRDRDDRDRDRDDRDRDRGYPGGDNRGYGGWDPGRGPIWGREEFPREGACFYEDAGFRGRYFCVPRGGAYASLPGGFNDRISSVRVFGAGVVIYRDRDFRGRSSEIRRDTGNLRGGWGDTISSIRVF